MAAAEAPRLGIIDGTPVYAETHRYLIAEDLDREAKALDELGSR